MARWEPAEVPARGMHETLRTLRWSEGSPVALPRRVRESLSRALSGRAPGVGAPTLEGLPAGLDLATLDRVCRSRLEEPLESCSHQHLSSWKPQGAFRLFLRTTSGRQHTLIYKQTIATSEFNPILDRLPVTPGPAEYSVYRCQSEALARYLPQCLWAEEAEAGNRYAFLYEDLGPVLTPRRGGEPPVRALTELHSALDTCTTGPASGLLLRYLTVQDEMLDYYRGSLEIHLEGGPDRCLEQLLARFHDVEALAKSLPPPPDAAIGVVHGDPNMSNVKLTTANQVKFLDWEWAGVHIRHVDLAAMLKFMTPPVESQALSRYSGLVPAVSPREHRQLYFRSKLDRSLLDMSLMSALVTRPAQRRLNVQSFLNRSARAALHAVAQLQRSR